MDAKDYILRIVEQRTKDNPISVPDLTALVNRHGFSLSERLTRDTISKLRKEGELICSVSKAGGGYYMATNRDEYLEFRRIKYSAQVIDMLETLRAMDHAAEYKFNGLQERLF